MFFEQDIYMTQILQSGAEKFLDLIHWELDVKSYSAFPSGQQFY